MRTAQDPESVFEDGKDAFHRVPFIAATIRDAVERVLTRFRDARRVALLQAVVGPETRPGISGEALPSICNLALAPKPFSGDELVLRVKAVLRRTGKASGSDLPAGVASSEASKTPGPSNLRP